MAKTLRAKPDEDARFIIDGGNRVESKNVHWLKYFPPFSLSVVIFATPLFVCGVEKKNEGEKKKFRKGARAQAHRKTSMTEHTWLHPVVWTRRKRRGKKHIFPRVG